MTTILETDRLTLRPFSLADYADLCRLSCNPRVMRYVGHGRPRTEEQVTDELEAIISYYAVHPGLGQWALYNRQEDVFVGEAGLYHLDHTNLIEVGFRLLPEYWGQGLATEAARTLVDYGFVGLGLERIVGVAHPDNTASLRVLEKAGLKRTGNGFYYGMELAFLEKERPANLQTATGDFNRPGP